MFSFRYMPLDSCAPIAEESTYSRQMTEANLNKKLTILKT